MKREGPGNSVFMCYPGYEREFELPCPKLSLYSVKRLTLQMEKKEPPHHSTAGPMTRGRTRRDAQLAEGGTSRQAGVSRQAVLALLKYPFYPLFILDNCMNSISKSLTVLTPA